MATRSLRPRAEPVDYKESNQGPSSTPRWVKLKAATEEGDNGKRLELRDGQENEVPASTEKPANNRKGRGASKAAPAAEQAPVEVKAKQAKSKKPGKGAGKGPVSDQPVEKTVVPEHKKTANSAGDAANTLSNDTSNEPEERVVQRAAGKTVRIAKDARRHTMIPAIPSKEGSPTITTRSRGAKRAAEEASLSEAESKSKKRVRHSQPTAVASGKREEAGGSQVRRLAKAAKEAGPGLAQETRNGGAGGAEEPLPLDRLKGVSSSKRGKDASKAGKTKEAGRGPPAAFAAVDAEPREGEAAADKGKERVDCTAGPSRLVQDGNEPAAPSAAVAGGNFRKLQEEYSLLHSKYQEVKAQRIQDVEGAIQEIRAQEKAHSLKAMQLSAHWEAEAQRQAAIAQDGDIAVLRQELDAHQAELTDAQRIILEQEVKVLEKEEENAELRRRLGEMIRLVEAIRESEEVNDDAQELVDDEDPDGTPAGRSAQSQHVQSQALGSAAELLQIQSTVKSAKSAQSQPAGGAALASAAKSNEQAGRPAVPHIQAARAWCPEGASLSEPYAPPSGVGIGAQIQDGGPAGKFECRTSAKPLVPYTVGRSVNQRSSKSRFAAEAGIDGAAEACLPSNTDPEQNEPAAQPGEEEDAVEACAEQAIVPYNTGLKSKQASRAQSPHIERQLTYTPGSAPAQDALQAILPLSGGRAVSQGTDSDVSHTQPLSIISHVTNKGMVNLVGLQILEATSRGGFSYIHPESGFAFEISPSASSDSDEEDFDLAFRMLNLGSFADADPPLPSYLRTEEEIKFTSKQRLMLVSRIMEHIGRFQRTE